MVIQKGVEISEKLIFKNKNMINKNNDKFSVIQFLKMISIYLLLNVIPSPGNLRALFAGSAVKFDFVLAFGVHLALQALLRHEGSDSGSQLHNNH